MDGVCAEVKLNLSGSAQLWLLFKAIIKEISEKDRFVRIKVWCRARVIGNAGGTERRNLPKRLP